ncbi:armadillo-type protein [Cladochytrium replicatum]|nr:armadillo-type protein [Cladochytrium replicatum]
MPTTIPTTPQNPTRSLWLGNIDPAIAPSDLLTLFSPFGAIESLRVLPDKECAFVNFIRVEDATRAREEMQGSRIGIMNIRIGYGKVEAISDSAGMQPTKSLWIGNIPPTTDPAELEALFSQYGSIESARVLTHKNCGFVNFDKLEDAIEARKAMNGKEISGSIVKIGFAKVPAKESLPPISTGGGNNNSAGPLSGQPISATVSSLLMSRERSMSTGSVVLHSPSREDGFQLPQVQVAAGTAAGLELAKGGSIAAAAQAAAAAAVAAQGNGVESLDDFAQMLLEENYAIALPPLPEPKPNRRLDQSRLRELRKKLEGHVTSKEVDAAFQEVLEETVDLSTDYIGNVVLQRIVEKGTDTQRLRIIEKLAPHLAAIGVHKNGTWVVQKVIDIAKTAPQIAHIISALKPFTPVLLLDQFGNYVVQCCLKMGSHRNQFIFDAMSSKCVEIGTGRFGARAMRTCLESSFVTKRQQKLVSIAIVQNAVTLCTNANGSLLVTWLLESSGLPGRYRVLAPKLSPHVVALCSHKLASATILKLVNQRHELDARDLMIQSIFYHDDHALADILSDQSHGITLVQKILACGSISPDERSALIERVRTVLTSAAMSAVVAENAMGYKRLVEEMNAYEANVSPVSANGYMGAYGYPNGAASAAALQQSLWFAQNAGAGNEYLQAAVAQQQLGYTGQY